MMVLYSSSFQKNSYSETNPRCLENVFTFHSLEARALCVWLWGSGYCESHTRAQLSALNGISDPRWAEWCQQGTQKEPACLPAPPSIRSSSKYLLSTYCAQT